MDHPRIRGEHRSDAEGRVGRQGSSPHTRGALPQYCSFRSFRRIIPAYAGSTFVAPQIDELAPDHPRIRGEHRSLRVDRPRFVGSSPHTRGAHPRRCRLARRGRIIPAYAGSTLSFHFFAFGSQDHPRIRGEHVGGVGESLGDTGSSPHTRGAQALDRRGLLLIRIIPAYAGSTSAPSTLTGSWPDHPRIRGEHYAAHKVALEAGGSSPHTRGALRGRFR